MKNPGDDMEIHRETALLAKEYPHSRVFLVTDRKGRRCCVKNFGRGLPELVWLLEAISHLGQRGFKDMPELLFLDSGLPYFKSSDSYYYLTRWIDGIPADFRRLKDVLHAARLLARFHRFSSGFTPTAPVASRVAWGKLPESLARRLQELELFGSLAQNRPNPSHFDQLYLSLLTPALVDGETALYQLREKTYPSLVEEAKAWNGVCHQDFAQQNLIWEKNALQALDLDNCQRDLPARDLYRLLRRLFVHQPGDPYRFRAAVRAYREERSLSRVELEFISQLLVFPHDLWRTAYDHYHKRPVRHQHLDDAFLFNLDWLKISSFAANRGFYKQMAADLVYSDSLTL